MEFKQYIESTTEGTIHDMKKGRAQTFLRKEVDRIAKGPSGTYRHRDESWAPVSKIIEFLNDRSEGVIEFTDSKKHLRGGYKHDDKNETTGKERHFWIFHQGNKGFYLTLDAVWVGPQKDPSSVYELTPIFHSYGVCNDPKVQNFLEDRKEKIKKVQELVSKQSDKVNPPKDITADSFDLPQNVLSDIFISHFANRLTNENVTGLGARGKRSKVKKAARKSRFLVMKNMLDNYLSSNKGDKVSEYISSDKIRSCVVEACRDENILSISDVDRLVERIESIKLT